MKPTTLAPTSLGLGVGQGTGLTVNTSAQPALPASLVLPENFPVNLEPQQLGAIQDRVAQFDFASLPTQHIALLGQEPTTSLNRVLGEFLTHVEKNENPQMFKLVDALSEALAKENIGALAEQMLSATPSLKDRVLGVFSQKAMQRGLDRAYEELGRVARNKSKTLSDVVDGMERKLQVEMTHLGEELRNMDVLKGEYRKAFVGFAEEVVFLNSALAKAQAQAPALLAAADKDVIVQQEIHDKLQALESVALARETMMTRMPAEAMLIRQVQNAGISTLQELTVTMGDRFASIRMTLLGIHGANLVGNVQRLGQANATLDNQLQTARAKLMGTVVAAAANATGHNRLEQANNLKRVVGDTRALQNMVEVARGSTHVKLAEARSILSGARQELLALGQQISAASSAA